MGPVPEWTGPLDTYDAALSSGAGEASYTVPLTAAAYCRAPA